MRVRALVALASGIVFASTSPPIDFHAGVLIGLCGFAFALEGETRPRKRIGALYGWCFGLGANLVALRFVPDVILRFTPLPSIAAYTALVLLAAAQGLPWAIGGALSHRLARGPNPLAPSWLAFGLGIYFATFLPAVFPWTPSGGLSPWPAIVQSAEIIGERGATLLFAIFAGLVALGIARAKSARSINAGAAPLGLAAAILVVLFGWGTLRMHSVEAARVAAPRARVALVQPGFEPTERWDPTRAGMMMDRLTALTKTAEQRGTDLTVWPESAYPYTLSHAARMGPIGSHAVLQFGVHGPVLAGAYMTGAPGVAYNSVILATPDGALAGPYDKRHLLAFGEAVPFGEWFPALKHVFAKGPAPSPGNESVVFTVGAIRAAVLNCFEDTLPEAGREAMEHAPNLLVNVTNDAWFVGSAESELHLRLAALRAIETRRDFVRAVNKGPTSFVEATGRVHSRYDLPMPGTLQAAPALLETAPTFYVRFGDLPVITLALAAVIVPFARTKRRERHSPKEERSPTV